jgi:hypothetical protein
MKELGGVCSMPSRPSIPPTHEPKPTTLHDWLVYYLVRRSPAKLVGWVKASDASRAVKQAAKEFGKDARRLIAVRRP